MVIAQTAWNVFDMSQTNLHWERHLKDLSETSQKRHLFWEVFKTSQIHLKKDVVFVTSLRRLKYISKKMFFWDIFKQMQLKKDVFQVTSLRRLKHISKKFILWRLWYVWKIYSLKVFVTIQQYHTKMVSCW